MLEGHLTDHEPNRNLPHPFQNNPKTLAAIVFDDIDQFIVCSKGAHFWKHLSGPTGDMLIATTLTYSRSPEFCPLY
jgi:hypothetical protein